MFSGTTHSQHRQPCRSLPQGCLQVCVVPRGPAPLLRLLAPDHTSGRTAPKVPGSCPWVGFLPYLPGLGLANFGNRRGGAVRAEMKVSTWRKSPIGRNTNTRLSWEQVNIHSTFQYSIKHRLPFIEKEGRCDGAHLAASPSCLAPSVCPVPRPEPAQGLGLSPALQPTPISEKSERYWILLGP